MAANWVENNLIDSIDRSRSGINPTVVDERLAEHDQCLRIFSAAIMDGYERATQFPEQTIGQLRRQTEPGLEMGQALRELGRAKRALESFQARYPELSRRRIRRLVPGDEVADLRVSLLDLEAKVTEAQQRYDDIMACWQARDFLRTLPELVSMVLHVNRKSGMQFTAEKLILMFPD
jgi:hypothetical protein